MRNKISGLVKKVGSVGRSVSRRAMPYVLAGAIGVGSFMYGCKPDPIEVPNNPPVANVSASPIEGTVPLDSRIKVDGTDKDGKSDIASYSLEIKELGINFSKPQPIDTLLTFSNPGDYTVKGTVRDKSGDSDSKNINLKFSKASTPENNIPVASVSADPSNGEAPFESRIRVEGTDEDGIDDIKKYFLEIDKLGMNIERTNPIDTSIVFSNSGEYNIRGIVEDSKGARDSLEVLVNVNEPENNIPVASVFADPSNGEAPFESRIRVEGADEDGIEDIKKYFLEIDKLGMNIERTNPIDTSIVFSNSGEYNIRGIVEDSKGARDSLEVLVSVSKRPEPSVNQSVSLKDFVNINYNVNFENTSEIELEIIKEGEKILSKNISNSGHSELFDYYSDNKFTKGFYEFVANFKTNSGKDTSVVSTVEIPNYNPEVDWSGLNINFDENSSTTVNIPNPTDKNPEDNPVSYIPESFSSDKANLEFSSENNFLNIEGLPYKYGSYKISGEFGSSEGGFGNTQKYGEIYEKPLPGMNPFGTPNLFGQGGSIWENASREEKLRMLDEANMQDKSWEWIYEDGKFTCGSFALAKAVNMFGCEDLESWSYYSIFENAIENNNLKIRNGYGNIPVYWIATSTDPDARPNSSTTAEGHAINGVWVGPDNYVEKRDATNFEQWAFFEPQLRGENGTYYVKPGDFSMNDNERVSIYWFGKARNYFSGEWNVTDVPILQYQLTDGKAELDPRFAGDGVTDRLIRYDPYE